MSRSRITVMGLAALLALAVACSRQSAAPSSPSAPSLASGDAAADVSTLKSAAPVPISPINNQQLQDTPTLTTNAAAMKFGGPVPGPLAYRFQLLNAGATVVDSGPVLSTSYRVTATLAFKTAYSWRVRAEYGNEIGPWSATATFVSSEGGYIRGNEVLDPLFNGVTVGEVNGPVTFVPNKGVRLETVLSFVRYVIPQTITAGEFSLEVEGLRANAPGDKTKVFSMSTNGPDFIIDPYRVDIQYRGSAGFPPNAVQYRVLYGSATDLSVRYEPDTTTRLNSILNLSATQTTYWKYTWGNGEVRLVIQDGGAKDNGRVLYNQMVRTPRGTYNPQPHYAYLGAPSGRSGAESASIPGSTFRNVWIGARPRP